MFCYFRWDFGTIVFYLNPYFFHVIAGRLQLNSPIRLIADCLNCVL